MGALLFVIVSLQGPGEAGEADPVTVTEIRTSPKTARRPNARSRVLRDSLVEILDGYEQATVRQVFYRAVVAGTVEKTEQAYKRVADALVQMRLDGTIPYSKIVDGHRTRRLVPSWDGARQLLKDAAAQYRRNFWASQPEAVELWCEKDALSGILQPIAEEFGLPYVTTRGFPSLTLVHESASAIAAREKRTTVLYFGDHDASGVAIDDRLRLDLQDQVSEAIGISRADRERFGLGPARLVEVERIALHPEQVEEYGLPTRPGKASDSRHRGFVSRFGSGASVELDALPPNVLEEIVREEILERIDAKAWKRAQRVEELERETLEAFVAKWPKRVAGRRV